MIENIDRLKHEGITIFIYIYIYFTKQTQIDLT